MNLHYKYWCDLQKNSTVECDPRAKKLATPDL